MKFLFLKDFIHSITKEKKGRESVLRAYSIINDSKYNDFTTRKLDNKRTTFIISRFFIVLISMIFSIFVISNKALAVDAIDNDSGIKYVVTATDTLRYISVEGRDYVVTKKTMTRLEGGKEYYVYCVDHSFGTPGNYAYSLWGSLDDASTNCLINGFPNKRFTGDDNKDYYITNVALQILNSGKWAKDSNGNDVQTNLESIQIENGNCVDNYGLRSYIMDLVNLARSSKPTFIKLGGVSGISEEGEFYLTNKIEVTASSTLTDYDVNCNYEVVEKDLSGFKVKIPKNVVNGKETAKITGINVTGHFNGGEAGLLGGIYGQQEVTLLKLADRASDSISFEINTPKMKIVKKGINAEGDEVKLEGVEIAIYKDGKEVKRGTTDKNGEIDFGYLASGKYTAKEVKTLDGYILDESEEAFEVVAAVRKTNDIVLDFVNELARGELKIVKTSSDGNAGGFKFRILGKSASGVDVDCTFITNDQGLIDIKNMLDGEYTISEVVDEKSVEYIREDSKSVSVKMNETTEVNFYNEKIVAPKTGEFVNYNRVIQGVSLFAISIALVYMKRKNHDEK